MAQNALLNHYKIDTPFPTEWPADKDGEDSDDEEGLIPEPRSVQLGGAKSRYSVLERNPKRTSVPGAERTKDGFENLVQRDEQDPLGKNTSVMQVLRRKGVPVEDGKLRNRYLLSSTTFSPLLFLSEVHSDASTKELMDGLGHLSQSIEQKSASLKILVESNFEKFVRAKATIDNVYREMVNPGQESEGPPSARRPHSRQTSRQSAHFRKTSGPFSPQGGGFDKRKNALVKEQEYGILPIKVPLLELKAKVDDVWGPALGGREREDYLKVFMTGTEQKRNIFDIGANITESIKRREYEMLVEEYTKAKHMADDARTLMENAQQNKSQLSDADVLQIVSTARMWSDIEDQIDVFKRDVWRRLAGVHFSKHGSHEDGKPEEYMELIGILLELGVEDNPIWVWLLSQYDYLKHKILGTFERSKVEIEILRRRLSYAEKPSSSQTAAHLKSAHADGRVKRDGAIDSSKVIELWEHIYTCLSAILSTEGGILGEVIEFWETAQSFIEGKAQSSLPVGIDGKSREHHRLSMGGVKDLNSGAQDLMTQIRDNILFFFTDLPTEDLSLLLSPIPPTPLTPKTPKSATVPSFGIPRLAVDVNNIPPPSPRRGDSWEKYAFWPPYSNSLSGAHYLSKILHLVATAACEMASLKFAEDSRPAVDSLKLLVGSVRERSIQAICAAWNSDCEDSKALEDWTRAFDRPDLTNLPSRLMDFHGFLLVNLQKILYVSEATKRPTSTDIIVPPSNKLLQMVRSQFVGGIYKVINGMKDHAESSTKTPDDSADGLTTPARDPSSLSITSSSIDASNRNVRILLTLSNIQGLRNDIMPHLISMFETNFSLTLTEEADSIRDVLGQIDARLFQSYVAPMIGETDKLVRAGIGSPTWAPKTAPPLDAKPYVYKVLLSLVLVHTEISTTSQPLTSPILKHLLEKYLLSFFEAFKLRTEYNLAALMQATLDVEFLAQTLANYTTEKASKTQGDIYILLDTLTDKDARFQLQSGLQQLRQILKSLREGTRTELYVILKTIIGQNWKLSVLQCLLQASACYD
ncbi:exocyst complex component Sec5 [Microthyrium microscopicum]|uniref:Exocyst complex component SEC5 n=1 Tax=Microthyrium microscopicum TaxID=703497 RepID=A0A6A6U7B8_9PEZI|nr:exocyst complex component Sec5 [Microthyrium microscopicum]